MVSVRPISAEEYNEVLRTRPALCLPAAVGDFRSGQQLLHDTPAEKAQTLDLVAQTRRGRMVLDRLTAVLRKEISDLLRTGRAV